MILDKECSHRLSAAIRASGISQVKLAAMAGVSVMCISHIMTGHRILPETLDKIELTLLDLGVAVHAREDAAVSDEGHVLPHPIDSFEFEEFSEALWSALARVLPPNYIKVLRMRWCDGMTLEQCGNVIGYTKEGIRQLEAKAMDRLALPSTAAAVREAL